MRFMPMVVILLLLLLASPKSTPGRSDPLEVLLTGKISHILYLSAVLKRDPLTDAVVIPTRIGEASAAAGVTSEEITRYMRLYFPRTYGELEGKYEFILLRQINPHFFSNAQLEWMKRSI